MATKIYGCNMTNRKTDENKIINRILLICALIVLVSSLEALMLGKSKESYEAFIAVNDELTGNYYMSLVLVNLIRNIIEPFLISLYVFFTYKRHGFPKVFKFAFGTIIALKIFNLIITFNVGSIFYYLLLILNIIFFIVIITIPKKGR